MNNNLLSKDLFIEIMEDVKQTYDFQNGLNNYLRKNGADGYIYPPDCVCATLKLLHYIFEKDVDEWISYFCFELDFGRKYKDGNVLDKDGKCIPLETFDDLYNLLTT